MKVCYFLSPNCLFCMIQFQQGQRDVFKVEAVTLDEVKQVLIGHDGKGKGMLAYHVSTETDRKLIT